MKMSKPAGQRKTPGALRAAQLRARCNKLTEAQRRELRDELAEEAIHGEDFEKKEKARRAFRLARTWNIQPADLLGDQHESARGIGRRLRGLGLLPADEVNDGLILAEAALLGCSILLSS